MFGWFIKLIVQTFEPLVLIYMSGNFVCHHCGCTLILSYSFDPCILLLTISIIYIEEGEPIL